MNYILKSRGKGKTYDLITRSAKTGDRIICANKNMAWKFDKYYEKHPDEFAEQFWGCKLFPYQKALLKMLSVRDNIRPILYPKHSGYAHLMFVYKIAEFILSDSKSMVFLCGSDINKHYKEIVKFTNGADITVTMRKDKEMITLEKH